MRNSVHNLVHLECVAEYHVLTLSVIDLTQQQMNPDLHAELKLLLKGMDQEKDDAKRRKRRLGP